MLRVSNISKHYGQSTAVDDVSLIVRGGRILSLIGPNGAGKSSTFRMVVGLLRPDSGSITLEDAGVARHIRSEDIGFLPEERGLYQDVRICDLLEYWGVIRGLARASAKRTSDYWLDRFELSGKRKDKVSTLSKGNQQKLQLAACLLHRPRYLVLDEPFSGLDPVNQEMISSVLHEQCSAGVGILLSAHQLSLVQRISDQVLIIKRGRIVSDVVPDDVEAEVQLTWSIQVTTQGDLSPEHPAQWSDDEVISAERGTLMLRLRASSESDLYARLSVIAARPDVHTAKIVEDDLHQRYLSVVRSTAQTAESLP